MTRRAARVRRDHWEDRYAYNAIAENADEAEWEAVVNGSAHLSAGTADDAIAETGDEFAPLNAVSALDDDRLQGQELLQEARQGTVREIIEERSSLLGPNYPFEISGNSLIHRPGPIQIYELLLGTCQSPSLTAAPYCELPRVFEELSTLAGRGFLGPNAKGYRTGWPRPADVSHFKAAVAQLREASGDHLSEWQWQPAEHLPDDPAPKFVKEDGLDVVVWNQWPDQRTGQLYLVGQCACGKDWLDKDKDLDLDDLGQWFRMPRVEPVRSFFTPRFAIHHLLNEMSHKAGLVFDRVRIVQALAAPHLAAEVAALAPRVTQGVEIAKRRMPAAA